MINKSPVDSLIFDMDGTLWDAVDSYAVIWNTTLDQMGIEHQTVTRDDLLALMGSYLDDILDKLIPDVSQRPLLLAQVMENETAMMPVLGGKLYPHVKNIIPALAQKYKLFMVSNCGPTGLENFVHLNGLQPYFTDLLSHGSTGKSKTDNIRFLIDKYNLKSPVYIGDTQSDADSAHRADVPFIHTAYGFGKVTDSEAQITSFDQLPSAIDSINSLIEKKA